jgi:uncharacterized membrane-anchored protein
MKYLVFTGFFLLMIAQWFVPVNMIRSNENVLKNGKVFRFQTQPIDPNNPFIGKYIWLNFKETDFNTISKDSFKNGDDIYVLIVNNSAGFAKIAGISKLKPTVTADYIKAECNYAERNGDTVSVSIDYPFTKFYMDEYKAPKAETEYRKANLDTSRTTFALVAILNGDAVIKDVMIDNRSVKSIVQ